MLCLFVYPILELGMRYLLRFNLFLMTELLNEKQPELLWGNRLLSNFHVTVPRFSLISSSTEGYQAP